MKELGSSLSENKIKDTEISSSLCLEDTNSEMKNGNSDQAIQNSSEYLEQSNDTKTEHSKHKSEDIADCCNDILTSMKPDIAHSEVESKSLMDSCNGIKSYKRKLEELSNDDITKSVSPTDIYVKVIDADFKENTEMAITTNSENNDSKEIKVSDKEDLYIASEITSNIMNKLGKSVLERKVNSNKEEFNNVIFDSGKPGLVHKVKDKISEICEDDNLLHYLGPGNALPEKIQENGDKNNSSVSDSSDDNKDNEERNDSSERLADNLYNKDSFSEIVVNDSSNKCKINQPITVKYLDSMVDDTQPCLESTPKSCSSLSNIENNTFNEFQHSFGENKEKVEDKGNISAILVEGNSTVVEGDSETDIVWKRKRRMSDEKIEFSKRRKHDVTRLNDTEFNQFQHGITSSEPSCKWNTEESNSFFEELIYSDEDKNNNFSDHDISYKMSKSTEECTKFKENLSHKIKNFNSKSDLDKKIIEKSNIIKSNCSLKENNFEVSPECLKGSANAENVNTPHRKVYKEWKEKKSTNAVVHGSSQSSNVKENCKVTKISSKSKTKIKSKVRSKSKKSSLSCKDNVEDLQTKDEFDNSYESMLKKVKKQLKNDHRG